MVKPFNVMQSFGNIFKWGEVLAIEMPVNRTTQMGRPEVPQLEHVSDFIVDAAGASGE